MIDPVKSVTCRLGETKSCGLADMHRAEANRHSEPFPNDIEVRSKYLAGDFKPVILARANII